MDRTSRINPLPEMEAVGDEHRDSKAASAALQQRIHHSSRTHPFVSPCDGKHSIAAAQALLRHLRGDAESGKEKRTPAVPWYRSAGAF